MKISVLVDLILRPDAGGHVKCWERFAEAAARRDDVDLTVHFQGQTEEVRELSPSVRYHLLPPRFSTKKLPFLTHIPDHTDLASYHPALARALAGRDIIHTTDAFFAYARTAAKYCAQHGLPLVNSVHTETPAYTRVYTRRTVEGMFGESILSRLLLEALKVDVKAENRMLERLVEHQRRASHILVSRNVEREIAEEALGAEHVSFLRRGIDKHLYKSVSRDRAWLATEFGVPQEDVLVLYVGRMSLGKNVGVLLSAMAKLVEKGLPVRLFCAGEGEQIELARSLLKDRAHCPGAVPVGHLAKVYASSDIFAFPSEHDIFANVLNEAQFSGLPLVVSSNSGHARLHIPGQGALMVKESGPEAWASQLELLVQDKEMRQRFSEEARRFAEESILSWDDVLEQELMPVWRHVLK